MSKLKAVTRHHVLHDKLIALIRAELAKEDMPAIELLAVLAQIVGATIAFQDQTKLTARMCLDVVQINIEIGNARALTDLAASEGTLQ